MVLDELEKDARAGWKGLWADPQPVPRWDYHKARTARARDFPQ